MSEGNRQNVQNKSTPGVRAGCVEKKYRVNGGCMVPTAWEKKLLHSLTVLFLMLHNLLPDGRVVKSSLEEWGIEPQCWWPYRCTGRWIYPTDRGEKSQWSATLFAQAFGELWGQGCEDPMLVGDNAGQDTLDGSSVKGCDDGWRKLLLLELSDDVQVLLMAIKLVLDIQKRSSVMWTLRNFSPP